MSFIPISVNFIFPQKNDYDRSCSNNDMLLGNSRRWLLLLFFGIKLEELFAYMAYYNAKVIKLVDIASLF